MTWGMPDMPFELFIELPTNKQILPVIIAIAIVVVVGLIIVFKILSIRDKSQERRQAKIDMKLKREKVMDGVVRREKEPTKTVHQVKRESRDPSIRQQQEAAVTNTLVGGTSEAQKEEKHAADYYGQLGISSSRSKQLDKAKDRAILNGYLQKSNTAPIRPVYSNTPGARQQQMDELNSDNVGAEANTPALVMDSAAPSAVRYTDNTYHRNTRQKAIHLKRPSSARAVQPGEEAVATASQETSGGIAPDADVPEQSSNEEAGNT